MKTTKRTTRKNHPNNAFENVCKAISAFCAATACQSLSKNGYEMPAARAAFLADCDALAAYLAARATRTVRGVLAIGTPDGLTATFTPDADRARRKYADCRARRLRRCDDECRRHLKWYDEEAANARILDAYIANNTRRDKPRANFFACEDAKRTERDQEETVRHDKPQSDNIVDCDAYVRAHIAREEAEHTEAAREERARGFAELFANLKTRAANRPST